MVATAGPVVASSGRDVVDSAVDGEIDWFGWVSAVKGFEVCVGEGLRSSLCVWY